MTKEISLQQLHTTLAERLNPENSVALVFAPVKVDAATVVALRLARRWCDELVVAGLKPALAQIPAAIYTDALVNLSADLPPNFLPTMGMAPEFPLDAGYVWQTVLAAMPSMVVVPMGCLFLYQTLWRLAQTAPDLFLLKAVEVPDDVLLPLQLQVRQLVKQMVHNARSDGVFRVEHLSRNLGVLLGKEGVILQQLSVFCTEAGTWRFEGVLPPQGLLRLSFLATGQAAVADAFAYTM